MKAVLVFATLALVAASPAIGAKHTATGQPKFGVANLKALVIAANATTAVPAAKVDQTDLPKNFVTRGARFDVNLSFGTIDPAAQTFVAGQTGKLTEIVLPLTACNAVPASTGNPTDMVPGECQTSVPQVDVKLTTVSRGAPTAYVLADASDVTPAQPHTSVPSAAHTVVTFPTPPAVVAGKAYAIVVTPQAPWPPATYEWSAFRTDEYAHGAAYWHWGSWSLTRSGRYRTLGPFDFGFTTYVAR